MIVLNLFKRNFLKFQVRSLFTLNLAMMSCDDGPQRKRAALVLPTVAPEQTSVLNCEPSKTEQSQSLVCSAELPNETISGKGVTSDLSILSIRVKNHTNFLPQSRAMFTLKNSQSGEIETQSVGLADTWRVQGINLDSAWEISVNIIDSTQKTIGETKLDDKKCPSANVGGAIKEDQTVELSVCPITEPRNQPVTMPAVSDPNAKNKTEKTITSVKLKVLK